MGNTVITIIVGDFPNSEQGWECDNCHRMTTAEPIEDEGGQYCFCSFSCREEWERKHGYC